MAPSVWSLPVAAVVLLGATSASARGIDAQDNKARCDQLLELIKDKGFDVDGRPTGRGDLKVQVDAQSFRSLELSALQSARSRLGKEAFGSYQLKELLTGVMNDREYPDGAEDASTWFQSVSAQPQITPAILDGRIAAVQRMIEEAEERQRQLRRVYNAAFEQADGSLRCSWVKVGPGKGGAGGTSGGDPRPPAPPSIPGDKKSPGTGGAESEAKAVSASATDWLDTWHHSSGTIVFVRDTDLTIAEELEQTDASGSGVKCDRTAVYVGTAEWNAGGARWSGRVRACKNGDALEGKISNAGTGAREVRAVSFRIFLTNPSKTQFSGAYQIDRPAAAGSPSKAAWSGKRPSQ